MNNASQVSALAVQLHINANKEMLIFFSLVEKKRTMQRENFSCIAPRSCRYKAWNTLGLCLCEVSRWKMMMTIPCGISSTMVA